MYKNALEVGGSRGKPRWWWASTNFRAQWRIEYALLQHFSRLPHSVWREADAYAEYAAQVANNMRGPVRQHRPLQAIALLTDDQLNMAAGGALGPHAFSMRTFLTSL